jgi:cytoskeletal protein RodZ
LEKFGNTLLSPFKNNGKLKLIVVMIIFPVILNALNFWIIDNILKFKPEDGAEGEKVVSVYEKEEKKNKTVNKSKRVETNAIENIVVTERKTFENN